MIKGKPQEKFFTKKKQFHKEKLGGADPSTIAGLSTQLELFRKGPMIQNEEFNQHTVYLCGDEYMCEMQDDGIRVAALLSTENLLLNAYRQTCTGMDEDSEDKVNGWCVLFLSKNTVSQVVMAQCITWCDSTVYVSRMVTLLCVTDGDMPTCHGL